MSELKSYRRYCLMKRIVANRSGETANAQMWQHKQEAETGTDLPDDFPYYSRLAEGGYTTLEDLDGADDYELSDVVGLAPDAAASVLVAAAALL